MRHPNEIWKPVVGYEGYFEVSDYGRIRWVGPVTAQRRRSPDIIVPFRAKSGHLRISLSVDGVSTPWPVHQLVAAAFIGPRPDGMHTCHNDGDKENNRPSNLRYDTVAGNMRDKFRHNTACRRGHALVEANVYRKPNSDSPGARICRACLYATNFARRTNQNFSRAVADRKFQELVPTAD